MAQARVIRSAAADFSWSRPSVSSIRIITVAVALVIWEAVANSGLLYRDVVPSTIKIAVGLYGEVVDADFYYHLGITSLEAAVGFAVGSLIGVAVGIMLGGMPFLRKAVEPYINAIGSTPKIIFLPIIFLMFGVGIESKMAKGALSGFFPVVFSTILGMVSIRPVLLWVGKSFHLNWWQMVTKIYLPAMVAPIIVGLRLGMGVAIIGILVAEIKFSSAGLGFRVIKYYDTFQIAPMYAMLIIIFALAALANHGMTKVQSHFSYGFDEGGRKRSSAADLGGALR